MMSKQVHICSTYMCYKLDSFGATDMHSCHEKKGVDVLQKQFILIPIHGDDHWSLFVVVNPGHIKNSEKKVTCGLHLDPLVKCHDTGGTKSKVCSWLCKAWRAKHKMKLSSNPFRNIAIEKPAKRVF